MNKLPKGFKKKKKKNKKQAVLNSMKRGSQVHWMTPPPPINTPDHDLSNYEQGHKIDICGKFGVTYQYIKSSVSEKTKRISKTECAVQHVPKTGFFRLASKDNRRRYLWQSIQGDLELLMTIAQPYSIKTIHVIEHFAQLYLVQELITYTPLFNYISECKSYSEQHAARFAQQMLSLFEHMHDIFDKMSHGFLTPSQIFISEDVYGSKHVKVSGFGFSAARKLLPHLTLIEETPFYVAPELLTPTTKNYPGETDMWSVGVILFVMIFGYPPFFVSPTKFGKSERDALYEKIKQGFEPNIKKTDEVGYGPWFPDHVESSREVRQLIGFLLESDPRHRTTASYALESPWFQLYDTNKISQKEKPAVRHEIGKFAKLSGYKTTITKSFQPNFVRLRPKHFVILGKRFVMADADGDGLLTYQQLIAAVSSMKDLESVSETLQQKMPEFDNKFGDDIWSKIRLIWIAFEKNEENDSCMMANLPKDIIFKIIHFVTCSANPFLATTKPKINYRELLQVLTSGYLIEIDRYLYDQFCHMDENREGKIPVSYLKEKLQNLDFMDEYERAKRLDESDEIVDGQGKVDYAKFLFEVHQSFEKEFVSQDNSE